MKSSKNKLSARQLKFVQAYNGNATEAARKAGYSGNENTLGVTAHELLRNPKVMKAIRARQESEADVLVADRKERQRFWTAILRDRDAEITVRIRASELLGKSEGDFIERHEHSGSLKLEELIAGSIEAKG